MLPGDEVIQGIRQRQEELDLIIETRDALNENKVLDELGRQLRIDENVIRHLVVQDELSKGDEPRVDPDALETKPKTEIEYEEVRRGESR